MKVYRIALTQYCDTSGEGEKRYGGRWNLPGVPALNGGSSVSSSLLERLTIDSELFASERYVLFSIMEFDIHDELVFVPKLSELPKDWDAIPPRSASQEYGTNLLQKGLLCFGVPSVVDQTSLNYVLNPLAEKFDLLTCKVYSLKLDERIVR
jgi:RES domain-containing protein